MRFELMLLNTALSRTTKARDLLTVALSQSTEADDPIIIERVRQAEVCLHGLADMLKNYRAALRQEERV